jgi:hypothetical protein
MYTHPDTLATFANERWSTLVGQAERSRLVNRTGARKIRRFPRGLAATAATAVVALFTAGSAREVASLRPPPPTGVHRQDGSVRLVHTGCPEGATQGPLG